MAEIITYTSPSYQSWSANNGQVTNYLYTMLSAHDDRFSHTADTNTIRVNDQFNISITTSGSSYRYFATVSVMSPDSPSTALATYSYRYTGWNTLANGWNCSLIKTDDIFYLSFSSINTASEALYLGGIIYWFFKDNKSYFGIIGNTADTGAQILQSNMNIERLSLINVNDNSLYNIRKIADYNMNIDELFFTKTNVISDSAGNFASSDNLYSSSNLTYGKTFSIGDKNYYAIGTNTLIEVTT